MNFSFIKKTPTIISSHLDLNPQDTYKNIILCGISVFVSLTETKIEGFTSLRPHSGHKMGLNFFTKKNLRVFISVSNEILHKLPKNARYATSVHSYLKWGFKQKNKTILFTGVESLDKTHLLVYVFDNGSIVRIEERALPSQNDVLYQDMFANLNEELLSVFQNAKTVIAAPLLRMPSYAFADHTIFNNVAYSTISNLINNNSILRIIAKPASFFVASILVYGLSTLYFMHELQTKNKEYDTLMLDSVIQAQKGSTAIILSQMKERKKLTEHPNTTPERIHLMENLIQQLSTIPSITVLSFSNAYPVVDTMNQATYRLTIESPIDPKVSGLAQAKNVMVSIFNATGLSLQLSHQGWREVGAKRQFIIEGFHHE